MYSKKENKEKRQGFWIEFGAKCSKLKDDAGNPRKWILYKTGIKGVELKFEAVNSTLAVIIELNSRDDLQRTEMFRKFYELKPQLDKIFGIGLQFEQNFELPVGTTVSRIYCQKEDIDILDPLQKNDAFTFFISKMIRLEKVFLLFKSTIDEFSFADDNML